MVTARNYWLFIVFVYSSILNSSSFKVDFLRVVIKLNSKRMDYKIQPIHKLLLYSDIIKKLRGKTRQVKQWIAITTTEKNKRSFP